VGVQRRVHGWGGGLGMGPWVGRGVFRGGTWGRGFRGSSMGMGWFREGAMGGTGGVQGRH
jgi:hypothetical protein